MKLVSIINWMVDDSKIHSPEEKYKLIGKLVEELKLRRYSYQTGKSYISTVKDFLSSGKTLREFLLLESGTDIRYIQQL